MITSLRPGDVVDFIAGEYRGDTGAIIEFTPQRVRVYNRTQRKSVCVPLSSIALHTPTDRVEAADLLFREVTRACQQFIDFGYRGSQRLQDGVAATAAATLLNAPPGDISVTDSSVVPPSYDGESLISSD
jgi:hypothetical protein